MVVTTLKGQAWDWSVCTSSLAHWWCPPRIAATSLSCTNATLEAPGEHMYRSMASTNMFVCDSNCWCYLSETRVILSINSIENFKSITTKAKYSNLHVTNDFNYIHYMYCDDPGYITGINSRLNWTHLPLWLMVEVEPVHWQLLHKLETPHFVIHE